jgi:hypothetical protein
VSTTLFLFSPGLSTICTFTPQDDNGPIVALRADLIATLISTVGTGGSVGPVPNASSAGRTLRYALAVPSAANGTGDQTFTVQVALGSDIVASFVGSLLYISSTSAPQFIPGTTTTVRIGGSGLRYANFSISRNADCTDSVPVVKSESPTTTDVTLTFTAPNYSFENAFYVCYRIRDTDPYQLLYSQAYSSVPRAPEEESSVDDLVLLIVGLVALVILIIVAICVIVRLLRRRGAAAQASAVNYPARKHGKYVGETWYGRPSGEHDDDVDAAAAAVATDAAAAALEASAFTDLHKMRPTADDISSHSAQEEPADVVAVETGADGQPRKAKKSQKRGSKAADTSGRLVLGGVPRGDNLTNWLVDQHSSQEGGFHPGNSRIIPVREANARGDETDSDETEEGAPQSPSGEAETKSPAQAVAFETNDEFMTRVRREAAQHQTFYPPAPSTSLHLAVRDPRIPDSASPLASSQPSSRSVSYPGIPAPIPVQDLASGVGHGPRRLAPLRGVSPGRQIFTRVGHSSGPPLSDV